MKERKPRRQSTKWRAVEFVFILLTGKKTKTIDKGLKKKSRRKKLTQKKSKLKRDETGTNISGEETIGRIHFITRSFTLWLEKHVMGYSLCFSSNQDTGQ